MRPTMKRVTMASIGRIGGVAVRGLSILGIISSLAMYLAPEPLHAQNVPVVDTREPKPEFAKGEIVVGDGPSALFVYSSDKLFVANELENTVGVVDLVLRRMDSAIPVGTSPKGLGFDRSNNRLYVANKGSDNVSVVDPGRGIVVATIPVGTAPVAVTVRCCSSGRVYVTNSGSNDVSVIDPTTNKVVKSIPLGPDGKKPSAIMFVGASEVWVTNAETNNVSVIDTSTDTLKTLIPNVGNGPSAIAPACGNEVYVALLGENKVRVLDAVTKGAGPLISVGLAPSAVAERSCGEVNVTNSGSNTVSVIDTAAKRVKETIPVGGKPSAIIFSSEVYVANADDDTVTVLNFDESTVSVAVFLDGCTDCRGGDRFKAIVRVRNPTARAVNIEFKAGVIFPDGTTKLAVSILKDKHFEASLPPSFEIMVTLLDIDLPPGLPPGSWQYFAVMADPEDGTIFSRRTASFTIR